MQIPRMMQVVEITKPGGPEVLKPAERPVPQPGPGQILIRLHWAGVNRPEALQRAGVYPPPPGASDLPGLEGAGTIAALGEGVSQWRVGDEVTALLPGGGYAEYAVTDARHALPVPEGLSMKEAAALCETLFTVYSNLFTRGGLKAGGRVLIHGGSSGIGTTAVRLAAAAGARVIVTAGSEQKCRACLDLGAEIAINYREEDFVARLQAEGGADLILDMVGGSYLPRNIEALALDGRLVVIAFLEGTIGELDLLKMMQKRLTITGSTLRPQSPEAKARIAGDLLRDVWPMIRDGRFRPVMDEEFPLAEAWRAHERMESSVHIGKMVLKIC
ncbi:NAD(P)H-quinone oxidoreductase [Falsigemmobacter faecalis]|uniref:NAD(P)H-quinone oxidoreductase n=1 Tax=Falsigemmobacter faecalis TaxID=2488730 RepID=A0A3P3DPP6_9RHOB|nr:NAD(P)H-quinone oxidoreductase [Falsigemmobacter faecalis]RRH76165.1 NAD(P)H-quinone oxidoreductase [Falsigemmobacter faecalis]